METAELDGVGSAQAVLWAQNRRIWVVNRSAGSFQVRSEWLGRVLGLQSLTPQMVVTFDFRDGTAHHVIGDWGKRLMRRTDGFDDPDRHLRELAAVLSDDPESGWRALCDHETMTLALIGPSEKEPWLWECLRDGKASAIVLAETFPAEMAADDWKVEQLANECWPHIAGLSAWIISKTDGDSRHPNVVRWLWSKLYRYYLTTSRRLFAPSHPMRLRQA